MQNKEIVQYQYNINKVFELSVKSLLEEREVLRCSKLKSLKTQLQKKFFKVLLYLGSAITIILLGYFFNLINILGDWILYVGIIICGLSVMRSTWLIMDLIFYPIKANNDFIKSLKENMYPNLLKVFNDNLVAIQQIVCDINCEDLEKSQLFLGSNSLIEADDCFTGCHRNVKFTILEACVWDNIVKPFKGIFIKLTFNKPIKNRTIIVTKKDDIGNLFAFIVFLGIVLLFTYIMYELIMTGSWDIEILIKGSIVLIFMYVLTLDIFKTFKKSEDIKPLKLEDPKFHKKFKAYSSDQIEGRYLLSTSFIERFNNIRTAFGAKNAKCSFYDNNLLIAVSTWQNIFEIGDLFHTIDNPKRIDRFYDEIISIIQIIDHFKLDEKTGL